jgi:hypothetical protein
LHLFGLFKNDFTVNEPTRNFALPAAGSPTIENKKRKNGGGRTSDYWPRRREKPKWTPRGIENAALAALRL